MAHKMPCTVFFAERSLATVFLILFHFLKHLPFIEDKHKLKKLQAICEKQDLEDAGETDENDKDEEIDKVKRKQSTICYVPLQNYQIVVIYVGF